MTTYRQHAAARDNLRSQRPIVLSAETEAHLNTLQQKRVYLGETEVETTKITALEKQIAETKRMLEYPFRKQGYWDFSGREGYQLSKKGVTETYSSGSWGYDKNRYRFNSADDGRLMPDAYQWCVDNGLKSEADAYNRNALTKYVNANKERWSKRKAELETELAKVNGALAQFDAMLLEELSS